MDRLLEYFHKLLRESNIDFHCYIIARTFGIGRYLSTAVTTGRL